MRAERFQMQGKTKQMQTCQLKMDIYLFHRLQLEGCVNRDLYTYCAWFKHDANFVHTNVGTKLDNKCTVHADGYRNVT